MRIGITYDLKSDGPVPSHQPDDYQEEFDSPATIEAIATVLRADGHEVVGLGDGRQLVEHLLADPPDFVFNFAEGQGVGRSREARVPAILEMLDIPYTGSDPLTLAVTLDKTCAKTLVKERVAVPWSVAVQPEDPIQDVLAAHREHLTFPVMVKPAWEGSSKGIRGAGLVDSFDRLYGVVNGMLHDYQQPILVEEFIAGDELTVGIVGNQTPQIIGIMCIEPLQPTSRFVYSVDVKRNYEHLVRYERPALPEDTTQAIHNSALEAYRLLGCRDVARIDFRLRDGVPYFIEVNPIPGLHPVTSDLVILAGLHGWTFERLIEAIMQSALDRFAKPANRVASATGVSPSES